MRTSITLHKVAGKWSVVSLPDVAIDTQKKAFKALVVAEDKKGIEEVQIWESGSGIRKNKRFDPPKPQTTSSNMPDPNPYPKTKPNPTPEPQQPDHQHENEPRPGPQHTPDRGPKPTTPKQPVRDPATKQPGRNY